MDYKEKIVAVITKVAHEFNEQLENKIEVERGQDAPLYGREGVLDSLGLVTFIVAVEQAIEEELGVTVTLADEKAVSQRSSPFRTIGTLVEYVERQIKGVD
jgi:D-alanine--poly(phosphoribitol) ligase subunit 2